MANQTVTIGDQDVQITETEDGFEAVEVDDEPDSGVYLKSGTGGYYSFKIPIDTDFAIEQTHDGYYINFKSSDNVLYDEVRTGHDYAEEIGPHDCYMWVGGVELVEE